jgi:hypothetical protein
MSNNIPALNTHLEMLVVNLCHFLSHKKLNVFLNILNLLPYKSSTFAGFCANVCATLAAGHTAPRSSHSQRQVAFPDKPCVQGCKIQGSGFSGSGLAFSVLGSANVRIEERKKGATKG